MIVICYAGLGKAQRTKGFENVDVTFDAPVVLAAGLDQQRAQPGRVSRDIFRLDPTRS